MRYIFAFSIVSSIFLQSSFSYASEESRALWRYLNGSNLNSDSPILAAMDQKLAAGLPMDAAAIAIEAKDSIFVLNTVKSTFSPLGGRTNSDGNPVGDYALTWMMGAAKNISISQLMLGNYRFAPSASAASGEPRLTPAINDIVSKFYSDNELLTDPRLINVNQNYLTPNTELGVTTSLQYGGAIFDGGTNRRAVQKFVQDYLCVDNFSSIMSFRFSDNWVGKDVERTPGGEFSTYLNKCSGCHSGMDAARGAFAFYDYSPAGQVRYLGAVSKKLNNNPLNFTQGHMTTDAKWQHVGWLPINKEAEGRMYEGAKSFVQFFLDAPEFYSCLAKRSKNVMCPHRNFSQNILNDIAMDTKEKQNLKRLYARVATEVCLPEN